MHVLPSRTGEIRMYLHSEEYEQEEFGTVAIPLTPNDAIGVMVKLAMALTPQAANDAASKVGFIAQDKLRQQENP